MSVRRATLSALAAVVGGSVLAALPAPVQADVDLPSAGSALDLPTGVSVSATSGDPLSRAVADAGLDATVDFNDFPSKGTSYLLLSSGDAGSVFEGVPTSQLSTDFGSDGAPDASSITLTVAAGTPGAGCLFVDFALGTEETLGYDPALTPNDDRLTIVKDGTNYAVNAGEAYFGQAGWPESAPPPYEVHDLDYWHRPGDPLDPVPGTAEEPRLAPVTGLNNVTSRDTARIPLDVSSAEEVTITVSDAPAGANGDLDSVAFLDNVRLGASCANGTGVEPKPENQLSPNSCCGVIRGIRGVGNTLTYDPVPSTGAIELYDAPGVEANGWRSPSNKPVELRFRWYRTSNLNRNSGDMSNWVAIPNADRQSYVPTSVDRSKVLIVLVTGVVDGRRYETYPSTNTASTWYVTTQIDYGTFSEGEAPIIRGPEDGTASVGDTLTAQIGDTVPRQDTYDWQWYAKSPGSSGVGSSISGATDQNLVIGESQAGKVLTVRAIAKRDQFTAKTWYSAEYGPIETQTWTTTTAPQITHDGTPVVDEVLTAVPGEWVPTPTSYSYQWRRNGALISGAVAANYTLREADAGAAITVDVSGVRTGYAQVPLASAAVVPAGKLMTGSTPTITGTARVGLRLTGAAAGWLPAYSTLTYSWYAGDTLLQTGSSRYLTVPAGAVGKPIVLRVRGVKNGYEPLTVPSAATALVARGTMTAGTVRIYGTAKVGYTLRASPGTWSPSGVAFKYQWRIGSTWLSGTTRTSIKLPSSARGKRITLWVTGTKAGYTTTKKSAITGVVR